MVPLGLFGPLSGWEILLILLLVALLFGGRKIPELARGLGEGIRNFRSALRGEDTPDKKSSGKPEGPDAT